MPLISPQPRPRDTLKFFKPKAILASLACSVVLVGAVAWHEHWPPFAPPPASPTASVQTALPPSVPPCSAPAQSFCSTQVKLSGYVANGDFSDVLEQQIPDRIKCGTATAPPAVCAGIAAGLTVQVFSLTDAGATSYLTRNGYIGYLRQYSAVYGPFQFEGDAAASNTITMTFSSAKSPKTYRLVFQSSGGAWKLESSAVN